MPLSADTALVTAAEVAAITHEAGLSNPDDSTSGATLDNARAQATNYLIVLLKARGIQPALIANTSDLKIAAALITVYLVLVSLPDAESQARADKYKARFEEQVKLYVFESTATGDDQTMPERGLPRVLHRDRVAIFGARDNQHPSQSTPGLGYWQK